MINDLRSILYIPNLCDYYKSQKKENRIFINYLLSNRNQKKLNQLNHLNYYLNLKNF